MFDVTDSEYLKEGMSSYSFPFQIQRKEVAKVKSPHGSSNRTLHISLLNQTYFSNQPTHVEAPLLKSSLRNSLIEEDEQCQPIEPPKKVTEAKEEASDQKDRKSTKEAYQNIFSINLKANSNNSSPQASPVPQKIGIFLQHSKTISNAMYEPIIEEPTLEVLETEEVANTSRARVEINIPQESSLKITTEKSKLQAVMSPSEISTTDCTLSKMVHDNTKFKVDPQPHSKAALLTTNDVDGQSNEVIQSVENTPRRLEKLVLSQDGGISETYGSPHAFIGNQPLTRVTMSKAARVQRDSTAQTPSNLKEPKNLVVVPQTNNSFLRGSRSAHYPTTNKPACSVKAEGPHTTETSINELHNQPQTRNDSQSSKGNVSKASGPLQKLESQSGVAKIGIHSFTKVTRPPESSWRKHSTPFSRTQADQSRPNNSSIDGMKHRVSEGEHSSSRKPALSISLGDKQTFKTSERKIENKSGSIPKHDSSIDRAGKIDLSSSSIQRLKKIIGSANTSGSNSQTRTSSGMSSRLKSLVQTSVNESTSGPVIPPTTSGSSTAPTPHNPKMEPLFFKKKDPQHVMKQVSAMGSSRTKSPTKSRLKDQSTRLLGESSNTSKQDEKLKSSSNLSRPASSERSNRPLGMLAAALTKLHSKQSSGKKSDPRIQRKTPSSVRDKQGVQQHNSLDKSQGAFLVSAGDPAELVTLSQHTDIDLSKRRNTAESVGTKKTTKVNLQVHTPSLQNSRKTSIVELFSSGRMTPKPQLLTTGNILNMVSKEGLRIPEHNKIVPFKAEVDAVPDDHMSPLSKRDSGDGNPAMGPVLSKQMASCILHIGAQNEHLVQSELVHEPSSYIIGDNSCFESGQSISGGKTAQAKNHTVSVLQKHLTTVVLGNRGELAGKEGQSANQHFVNLNGSHPKVLTSPKDTKSWGFSKHHTNKPPS